MYKIETLKNGIRIVSEHIPYVKSVSLGIWVGTGSRNENVDNNGVSHFIEHMLFKGTVNRTAKDIAEDIDAIGGQINAFTAKEYTCYYTKTLDTHLDIAVDVLSDMFFHSQIAQRDIDIERKVILEEIGMYEDSPEDLVHDMLLESVWGHDPLGYSILGTMQSLDKINRPEIKKYMDENYTPANTVIAVAGNFEYNRMVALIEEKFAGWDVQTNKENSYGKVMFNPQVVAKEKDIEQTHLCIGFEGLEQADDRIYDLLVVNNIFGGGMSSRLFQKIREEKGLAYSIYSYPSSYQKTGLFTIYAGMNPAQVGEVVKLIFEEIHYLKKNRLSKQEVDKAKEQLKGNYILGLESIGSRMTSIGKSELSLRKIKTPEEVLNQINAITMESVSQIIDQIFKPQEASIATVGVIDKKLDLKKFIN